MTLVERLGEAVSRAVWVQHDETVAALLREAAAEIERLTVQRDENIHDRLTAEARIAALEGMLAKVRYLADKMIGYALTQEDADALLGLSFALSASEKEQTV